MQSTGFANPNFSVEMMVSSVKSSNPNQIFFSKKFIKKNINIIQCLLISEKRNTAITCSKLTIETLEHGVKYVQS